MTKPWTETLTLSVKESGLEQLHAQLADVAKNLDVNLQDVRVLAVSRVTGLHAVKVRLTGTPDGISDFEQVFAGEGWTTALNGPWPIDFVLGSAIQAANRRFRRRRRRRRAARSSAS